MFFFVSPTLLSTHMHNSQRLDTPNSVTILINHRPQPTLDAQKKASHTVNSVGDLQKPVRRLPVEEPTEKRHASSSDAGPLPSIQPQLRLPRKNRGVTQNRRIKQSKPVTELWSKIWPFCALPNFSASLVGRSQRPRPPTLSKRT